MKLHEIFFWTICFFLVGVFIASVTQGLDHAYIIAAFIGALVVLILLTLEKYKLAILGLVIFLGAGYYFVRDVNSQSDRVVFDKPVQFEGILVKAEQRLQSQKLVIDVNGARIQLAAQRYPEFVYGDRVIIRGIIKKPLAEAAGYFAKEGIVGLVGFPEINLISQNNGSPIKAALFRIRDFFQDSYKKVLPFNQATFLSGLTLGVTAEFSDEFEENMKITGTSHLVALSGYNISVIVNTLAMILVTWTITRKLKLPLTILFIIGFVTMTGAEASVVRAAIMASILLLADHLGREHYVRNSIMAAAGAMVAINPRILVFDVGFQLSFAALLGIIYLLPRLKQWLPKFNQSSFINWRRNLLITTAAQLAVLPLLIYHFGYFSPWGILTNVLLLEFIPLTMALGFFIGLTMLIWWPLAWLISLPTSVLLGYELGIINLFAKITHVF